jgi:hypothetical protein
MRRIIDTHPPGAFCWLELSTSDQNAAKSFYGSLFGWTPKDFPMGPNDFYTMFQLEERNTGAACTMRPEQRAQGTPPHWMIYRRFRVMQNRPCREGDLIPATSALPAPRFYDLVRTPVPASRADKAIRPAALSQVYLASLLGS